MILLFFREFFSVTQIGAKKIVRIFFAPDLCSLRQTAFTMRRATKKTLVTSTKNLSGDRACFVSYIDTDAEKVEYIDWLIHKIRTTCLFECSYELDLNVATFPDLSRALYIQIEEEHHVFPVRSAAEKVLLAEMLANGEMNRFFDVPATEGQGCYVSFEKANAIVPMDVDGAVYMLSSVLPEDLAAKVVGAAIEEI